MVSGVLMGWSSGKEGRTTLLIFIITQKEQVSCVRGDHGETGYYIGITERLPAEFVWERAWDAQ